MSLPSSMVSSDISNGEKPVIHPPKRLKRWQVLLLMIVLALLGTTAWQLLNKQQNSMIPGRPLSYLQTHLHTVVFGDRPGVVYLGTHYGLFTSTDGGHTWPQAQGELNANMITSIAVSPTNPDLLAVLAVPTSGIGHGPGIEVSANGGQSWHFTLPPQLPAVGYPYSIQSAPGPQGRFYVFFTSAGWFETQDLGQHWQSITSGSLANIQTPSLLTDPLHPGHLLMGGDQGLFGSDNDGQSWQQITAVQGSVISLVATTPIASQTRSLLVATDQGLYRWQDGQSQVTKIGDLPSTSAPVRLVLSADGSKLYALFGSDLWSSTDLGAHWTQLWHFTRGDMTALLIDPANPAELLAGFFSPGLVLISNDAGKTWQTLTN